MDGHAGIESAGEVHVDPTREPGRRLFRCSQVAFESTPRPYHRVTRINALEVKGCLHLIRRLTTGVLEEQVYQALVGQCEVGQNDAIPAKTVRQIPLDRKSVV